jgi:V8-like Glu-specific endopeptidase
MQTLKLAPWALAATAAVTGCKKDATSSASVKINNGAEVTGDTEKTLAAVVQIFLTDGRGVRTVCTGTFLSDQILITAAHCVDRAVKVEYSSFSSTDFEINPQWPRQRNLTTSACSMATPPQFDSAVVKFAPNTYTKPEGTEYGKLATHEPAPGDAITIAGYGNSHITQYEKYCVVPEGKKTDNLCHLRVGVKGTGAVYNYSAFKDEFTWKPIAKPGRLCVAECDRNDLTTVWNEARSTPVERMSEFVQKYSDGSAAQKTQLETSFNMARAQELQAYMNEKCQGNYDSRSYRETGIGTKRSGTNTIQTVKDGTITFTGGLGVDGNGEGMDASSGRGDSGGPLFITENGELRLAGTVSGGQVMDGTVESQIVARKLSNYNSTLSSTNIAWLKTLKAKGYEIPGVDGVTAAEGSGPATTAEGSGTSTSTVPGDSSRANRYGDGTQQNPGGDSSRATGAAAAQDATSTTAPGDTLNIFAPTLNTDPSAPSQRLSR